MLTVKQDKIIEYATSKSKFIGFACVVGDLEQVQKILGTIKKEYHDASHIVYAYRVKEGGQVKEKFYNSHEPSNSAGRPLLYLLQKKELMNSMLVVVRYFGGKKLGVGGLVRAYTSCGQLALEDNIKNY
ncbi:MAG: YigZ family protein [Patescibacteria group bacterium]|jgi:putative IMPACT (imprinted ancient) family translation regulator